MITIVAIGKKLEPWVLAGVEHYQKRLKAPWNIKWVQLPYSSQNGSTARQRESESILLRLEPSDYVILLDERGQSFSSPALSERLERLFFEGRQVFMVIGGAYGVSQSLRERANLVWSLSDLVFPHQLVRLVLTEQIYRASQIAAGGPYHHN